MRDKWIRELNKSGLSDLRKTYNDGSVDISEDIVVGWRWLVY